jgi:ElaB/YqjD/DUF883 family membrane-anchored ribosome-binding protein
MNRIIPLTGIETEVPHMTKKKLMEDLKTVVNDAEELMKRAASDQPREWMASAQAKAKKSLKTANDWLTEEEEAMMAKARETAMATEDYVRTNTWMALGIAAAAGFFVGVLAVRFGLSVLEGGKRVITRGSRLIQEVGKGQKEAEKELHNPLE